MSWNEIINMKVENDRSLYISSFWSVWKELVNERYISKIEKYDINLIDMHHQLDRKSVSIHKGITRNYHSKGIDRKKM